MSVKEALEILGLNEGNLTSDSLKKAWRDFSKQYHPDTGLQANDDYFKNGNVARTILEQHLAKESFDVNYVMGKILSLNTFYVANFSNIDAPKIPVVQAIKERINDLKDKYVDEQGNLKVKDFNLFEKDYNKTVHHINQLVEEQVQKLLAKLEEKHVSIPSLDSVHKRVEEQIKMQRNIYSMYSAYEEYMKAIENYIRNNPLTAEYAEKRREELIKKYMSTKTRFENDSCRTVATNINRLCMDLVLKFREYGDVFKFEQFYKQTEQKIEKMVIVHRNNLLEELKIEQLSASFPQIDVIVNSAKLKMTNVINLASIYEVYLDTKKEVETAIKTQIRQVLEETTAPFKNDVNFPNVEKRINKLQDYKVEDYYKKAIAGRLDSKYSTAYQEKLYSTMTDYQSLVNKKQELLSRLEEFGQEKEAIDLIAKLNNTTEYEELERINPKAEVVAQKLEKNNRDRKPKKIQAELFKKLELSQQQLNPNEIRKHLRTLDKALELLDEYERLKKNIDIDMLSRVNFTNLTEDLEAISKASRIKVDDDDPELLVNMISGMRAGTRTHGK